MGTLFLVTGIVFVLSFLPLAYSTARRYRRSRGPRVVTCPETGRAVAVEVNAVRAALTGAFDEPELRLDTCSRWPERGDCGQECVRQIEDAPDGCLMRERLTAWYAGAQCAVCRREIGPILWTDRKPGLLTPDRNVIDWSAIAPESLPVVLETHKPACWNCSLTENFLRRYPDRVIKDPRQPDSRESGSRTNVAS